MVWQLEALSQLCSTLKVLSMATTLFHSCTDPLFFGKQLPPTSHGLHFLREPSFLKHSVLLALMVLYTIDFLWPLPSLFGWFIFLCITFKRRSLPRNWLQLFLILRNQWDEPLPSSVQMLSGSQLVFIMSVLHYPLCLFMSHLCGS